MNIKKSLIGLIPNTPWTVKIATQVKVGALLRSMAAPEQTARAERDPAYKRQMVEAYCKKNPKKAQAVQKAIDEFSRSGLISSSCDARLVGEDILFCVFAYGFLPEEYFYFQLMGKGYEERSAYVSNTMRTIYVYRMNSFADRGIFDDKGRTYEAFHDFFKRDAISVETEKDRPAFEAFVDKHPVFVIKQVNLDSGAAVKLIDINSLEFSKEAFFAQTIAKGKHIIEERIEQSSALSRINPTSVNTVRCVTIATKNGVVIPHCFFRASRGNAFVDNANAGGIFADVDPKTGQILSDAFNERAERFEKHPVTGVPYKGFQLPDWEQLTCICKEMTKRVPTIKYVSWDMAHTESGWVMVEGNYAGQMVCQQISKQQGIKEEIDQIIKSVDTIV